MSMMWNIPFLCINVMFFGSMLVVWVGGGSGPKPQNGKTKIS